MVGEVAPPPAIAFDRGVRRGPTLIVGCLGVALVVGSMVAFNTALGDIATTTSATQSQLNWIVDGYTLVLACLVLGAGAVGDRYGRRAALLGGLVVFSAASIAPAFFDTPGPVVAARMLAGAGAAFVMPATLALVSSAYPPDVRSKAIGIWAAVAGCAGVVGLFGSGLVLHFSDWRAICWALGVGGVVVLALAFAVPSSTDPDAPPVDWLGAGVIGAAIALVVCGVLEAPTRGWTDAVVLGCLTGGVALVAVFATVELRRDTPLLDVRLFAVPKFAVGVLTITVVFAATFGFFYLAMQYTGQILGYSALSTAVAFTPFMVPLAILSALSFWYLPKFGLRRVVFCGLALIAVGFVMMLPLEVGSSYQDLLWPVLIVSTGIGLCTAPTTSTIMATLQDDKQGVASAVNDTTREVGAALGIAVSGSLLAERYSRELAPALRIFPEPLRAPSADSLGLAIEIANRMGPQGLPLAEASRSAFIAAMQHSAAVMAVIVAVAAVLTWVWAPGSDGRQLEVVRRARK